MAEAIRKKGATIVLLFLQMGVTKYCTEFFSSGFPVPKGKKVVLSLEIVDEGVQCDAGSGF